MNAERRQKIQEVINLLIPIRDAEQDAYDALPESLQNSDKGEEMVNAIEQLEDALNTLEGMDL